MRITSCILSLSALIFIGLLLTACGGGDGGGSSNNPSGSAGGGPGAGGPGSDGPGTKPVVIGGAAFDPATSALMERTALGALRETIVTYADPLDPFTPTFTDTYTSTSVRVDGITLPCWFVDRGNGGVIGNGYAVDIAGNLREIASGSRNRTTGAVSLTVYTVPPPIWLPATVTDGSTFTPVPGNSLITATIRLNQTSPGGFTGCIRITIEAVGVDAFGAETYDRTEQFLSPGMGALLRAEERFDGRTATTPYVRIIHQPARG